MCVCAHACVQFVVLIFFLPHRYPSSSHIFGECHQDSCCSFSCISCFCTNTHVQYTNTIENNQLGLREILYLLLTKLVCSPSLPS